MAIETAADLAGFFDPAEFGVACIYTPQDGSGARPIVALLSDRDQLGEVPSHNFKLRTDVVELEVLEQDVPGAAKGDLVQVPTGGRTYKVASPPLQARSGQVLQLRCQAVPT